MRTEAESINKRFECQYLLKMFNHNFNLERIRRERIYREHPASLERLKGKQ